MKHFRTIMLIGFLTALFGCGQKNKKLDKSADSVNPPITKPVEQIDATDDQKERRAKSEKTCISKGIPIYENPNALYIEAEKDVEIRTKDEIVDRVFALLYIGLKSEGLEKAYLNKVHKEYHIGSKLTTNEQKYVYAKEATNQQQVNANWRYESLHVLLWSLGYIDNLSYPNEMCNVADDVKLIHDLGPNKFRENAKVRSKEEILDQADLILRYDWASVNARIKKESAPGGLNSSVVYERHYSLNWLIQFMDQDWDNVTTNT